MNHELRTVTICPSDSWRSLIGIPTPLAEVMTLLVNEHNLEHFRQGLTTECA
jgi:hypothetical protein